MNSQLNELSKGDKASSIQNRYNLRSKKKFGTPDVHEQPTSAYKPAKAMEDNNKGNKYQSPSPVVQTLVLEVK